MRARIVAGNWKLHGDRAFAPLVARITPDLPKVTTLVCLDGSAPGAIGFRQWLGDADAEPCQAELADDVAMMSGTGGTTGKPKGVVLTGHNIETMTALTLMSYPFDGRPVYLALAPLTHAAGVLCFPIMTLGGEIVIMPAPDLAEFLSLIGRHQVTHAFLPPTLIYLLLDHPGLAAADLTSLQCLWYGAAPMSPARLEQAIGAIGPVMGQLFGQTEAPMMISTLAPEDHLHTDGTLARERFASAGQPTPLVTVAIMDDQGKLLPAGQRGEIVVRGPLVMAGYYQDPAATAEASRHGWHHTGDIGYLDAGNYLYIVDRAKDMIITGGFNVYSAEVEQALLAHPAVLDCAVIGLPDDKWGERVTAIIQPHPGQDVTDQDIRAFVKARLGSVKTPKQVEVWTDLPRSKLGKILKNDVKSQLLSQADDDRPLLTNSPSPEGAGRPAGYADDAQHEHPGERLVPILGVAAGQCGGQGRSSVGGGVALPAQLGAHPPQLRPVAAIPVLDQQRGAWIGRQVPLPLQVQ